MIVVDTNIISEVMKPHPNPGVLAWLKGLTSPSIAISVITVAEIEHGLARLPKGQRKQHLMQSFADLTDGDEWLSVLPVTHDVAKIAGRLSALRDDLGKPATLQDMLIAASAKFAGAQLATRNVKDFDDLGLVVINPFDSGVFE